MPVLTIIALIEALAKFAPDIPEIVDAVGTAVNLLKTGDNPTAVEQAQIDTGLDAAHKALQAS